MTWYKLLTPSGHVLLNEYCESAASSAMPWQRHGHPADLFCPLLSVMPGAANPNGFLICGLCTINAPSPPSQTGTMDQHFPVCVCSFTSFVFTNLSPSPALAKPHCPLACLHHSLSFSLPCLVCNSPASQFLHPLLVLSVCGMGDSWSKQR